MKRIPMTQVGWKALRDELSYLEQVKRPEVIKAIAEAREFGDLSENAEYHAAREQQNITEGRIADVKNKLSLAQVIDISSMPNEGRVVFGSTVTLLNLNSKAKVTYQIVGDDEADIEKRKIAVNSPIARALIGKEEGDEAIIQTPNGETCYEILAVDYQ